MQSQHHYNPPKVAPHHHQIYYFQEERKCSVLSEEMRGKMEWQREIYGFSKGEGWSASIEKGKGGLLLVYKRYEEKKV
jgi:hypothetical protein